MLFPVSGTWMGSAAPSVGAVFLVGWMVLSAVFVAVLLHLVGEQGLAMAPGGKPAYDAPTRATMAQIASYCSVFMVLIGALFAYLLAFWPVALVIVALILAGAARLLWNGMGAALIRFG
jgi:uncharacterized membrane protein